MSKEKLEEVKRQFFEEGELNISGFEYLLSQAEEKNQLEERVKELENQLEVTGNELALVSKENQRYKEALSFYADESNHTEHRGTRIFGDVFYDKGEIARKALEADTQ